ncbi:MAG TPA: hypothetical protein VNB22_18685 [Pyrinomonadaceae bacterium]|nr:hypothetical protein [Pyrinomonadaceae bacterium]
MLIQSIAAFETDQFNLPPAQLADIGDEVSDYTEENLREAIGKINTEILARQNCPENRGKNCEPAEKTRLRLNYLRSEQAVAREVFNLLGAGFIPSTKSGTWMNSHKFKAQPARYKTSYGDSIYRLVPTNYLTISPTVKLYGVLFGTDKVAHLFQQGYTYYTKQKRAVEKGLAPEEAVKKAVRWGKISEQTYFGTFVSGVYSNGDLAANYAGMRFYQGLTHEIKIGETVRPPIVYLKDGVWTINENINLREMLLKPFISNHFNEALNSSKYSFFLRSSVRRIVRKKACGEWRGAFPALTQADFADLSQKLKLWHGEDYGFSESENFVTIANTCFGK